MNYRIFVYWSPVNGDLERGLPCWGTLEDRYKRLWRRAPLSIGALLGNLEGGSSTRDFNP